MICLEKGVTFPCLGLHSLKSRAWDKELGTGYIFGNLSREAQVGKWKNEAEKGDARIKLILMTRYLLWVTGAHPKGDALWNHMEYDWELSHRRLGNLGHLSLTPICWAWPQGVNIPIFPGLTCLLLSKFPELRQPFDRKRDRGRPLRCCKLSTSGRWT